MPSPIRHLTRRHCLKTLAAAAGYGTLSHNGLASAADASVRHLPLSVKDALDLPPPEGLATGFARFGWRTVAVGSDPVRLLGTTADAAVIPDNADCRLRLTTALDVRDDHAFEVSTPDGATLGTLVVRFAGLFQVQEMRLTPSQALAVARDGVMLRMVKGSRPVWFFAPSPESNPAPDPVQLPHLLVAAPDTDRAAEFEQRARGLVMLQGFGWQSGCVSEGLLDLAEKRNDETLPAAVDRYLGMYFTEKGVEFQSPRSSPIKDRVGGIEEPLPWATLARRQPDHPAIEIARKFLTSDSVTRNDISRNTALTTEGCYTAAYPTAVLSRVLNQPEMATIALRQLEARRLACVHDGHIYQRGSMGGDKRLQNWCRGVCWYYNGLVRTLHALDDNNAVKAWLPEVRRVAAFLIEHQRDDGLWGNFIHDPQSVTDTSGSAGLAAALARAHADGWLKDEAHQAARRALAGLQNHLTPDGLLAGAAQSNKGGDALQQGDYRTLYQMGMGLKLQLMAAL